MNQGREIPPFGPEPAEQVSSMLEALQKKQGKKGVIKDSDGKVNPVLTPQEEARYAKIFKVFKKTVFPGPEAGKLDNPAKKVAAKTQIGGSLTSMTSAAGGNSNTWMKALAGAILLMPWKDLFQTIWKSVKGAFAFGDLVKAMGIDDMLKMAKTKVLNVFGGMVDMIKNSKFMKLLEGGLSSLSEFGSKLKNSKWGKSALVMIDSIKNVFNGFEKIFSTIAKPIQKVGGAMFKGAGAIVKMVAGAGAKFLKFGKFIPFIGSIFNFTTAVQAFGNGEYGRGILEIISGVANIIPGGQGISAIMDGGLLLYDIFSESKTGEGTRDLLGNVGGRLKGIMEPIGDAVMGVFGWIGDALGSIFGMFKNITKAIFKKGVDMVSNAVSKIPGIGDWLAEKIDAANSFTADMFEGAGTTATEVKKSADVIQMSNTVQSELLELKKDEMKMYDFMCQKLEGIEKTNAAILASMETSSKGGNKGPAPLTVASQSLDNAFYNGVQPTQ